MCLCLVPRVTMPSTSIRLPPLLCYPSPRILPPLFPSIHILASCSATVPSFFATIISRPPQSPHRPLLPPLPSPLHCQFAPSVSTCSTASLAPATVFFASPPQLLSHILLLFRHSLRPPLLCPSFDGQAPFVAFSLCFRFGGLVLPLLPCVLLTMFQLTPAVSPRH